MALHALEYCERLFYFEEVEEIRVADARVYAGRRLHEQLTDEGDLVELTLESEELGLRGRLDALRRRDGRFTPYEHKRGQSKRQDGVPTAWDSDRLQVGAYAKLLEDATGQQVVEGRIRYHAENVLVKVPVDDALREDVRVAVARARQLRASTRRPPITEHERRCVKCSLAPICLPEETRKVLDQGRKASRLFPRDDARQTLHVFGHGTRIGRRSDELVVKPRDSDPSREPIRGLRSLALHGFVSISSQALRMCADHDIAVHWFGKGGWYNGSFYRDDLAVQRRIRQYEALREPAFRLSLARRLAAARAEGQLRFLLRASRGGGTRPAELERAIETIRTTLPGIHRVEHPSELLGFEGRAAAAYFRGLPSILVEGTEAFLSPAGRSRRPPRDGFNAMVSFGYALLLREVVQAIRCVGLDPAFGFYHTPRSAAPPLALDLIELFRVPCVDMAVVAAINRKRFQEEPDFKAVAGQVWLSHSGRWKLIEAVERRMADTWRHPLLGYSLSYRRHIELEVRLLEKEWSGEPGQFARTRIR